MKIESHLLNEIDAHVYRGDDPKYAIVVSHGLGGHGGIYDGFCAHHAAKGAELWKEVTSVGQPEDRPTPGCRTKGNRRGGKRIRCHGRKKRGSKGARKQGEEQPKGPEVPDPPPPTTEPRQ